MSAMTLGNNSFRSLLQTLRQALWVRQALVILFVLGGSFALALSPSMMMLMGILGMAAIPFLVRYPELGLVGTIFAGFAVPYYGPSGLNVTMIGIAGLIGLWFVETIMNRRRISWENYPFMRPMLGLMLVSTIALLIGQLPWFRADAAPIGAQIAGLSIFILSIAAFFYVAFRFGHIGWLQLLVFLFILYAPLKIIEKVEPSFFSISVWLFQYGSDGSQLWFWMVALIFGQLLFNWQIVPTRLRTPPLEGFVHLLLLVLLGAILGVMFVHMRDWKSAWVPTLAVMGAILFFRWPRFILIGGGVAGLAGAGAFYQSLVGSDQYSYATRLDAWSILLDMVQVNPITGLGPANYYNYTPLFRIRGYDVAFNSHNQYFDMLLQTGILGLACFIWIGIAIGIYGWRVLQRTPKGGFAHAYMLSAMGGLVAMYVSALFGDWILPFFYNVSLNGFRSSILGWVFLGGIVVVDRLVSRPLEEKNRAANSSGGSPRAMGWQQTAPDPFYSYSDSAHSNVDVELPAYAMKQ